MANGEDLIRREVAAFQACNWHVQPDSELFNGIKASIRSMINLAPAVDAVEVVRCKDCDHWIPGPDGDIRWGVCERHKSIFTVMNTPGDYYCADGERKG